MYAEVHKQMIEKTEIVVNGEKRVSKAQYICELSDSTKIL